MTLDHTRVRMSPESRREQLLDLGVRLLSTRALDELSIELLAEEAGISRGLLYHYFGNKQEFHVAVVRRAVEDLLRRSPPPRGHRADRAAAASLGAYVDYVVDNTRATSRWCGRRPAATRSCGRSTRRPAAALTDRIFEA